MAKYVVYIQADQLGSGMEQFVTEALARCGFDRAMNRQRRLVPLGTLLFFGESCFEEIKLARHLEKALKKATLRELDVLVFRLDKLRPRHEAIPGPTPLSLTPKYMN